MEARLAPNAVPHSRDGARWLAQILQPQKPRLQDDNLIFEFLFL